MTRLLFALALLGGVAHAQIRGDWSLDPSVRGQLVDDASGPTGQLATRYRVLNDFALEAVGRSGLAFAEDKVGDDVLFLALVFGFAYTPEAAAADWAPRASARFTHIHHATLTSWGDSPGGNLSGDSSGDVQHRSGIELALGLGAPMWRQLGSWGTGLDFEVTGGWLPSSDVIEWNLGLGVGMSFFSL